MPRFMCWLVLSTAVLLGGCKVDAVVPVNLSDIDKVLAAKPPVEITARLLLTFTSRKWCEDMGASLVVTLQGAGLNMMPVGCAQDPDGMSWHGELRMPVRVSLFSENGESGSR